MQPYTAPSPAPIPSHQLLVCVEVRGKSRQQGGIGRHLQGVCCQCSLCCIDIDRYFVVPGTCTHTHTHTHTQTHTHTHTHLHAHVHAYLHTRARTHKLTRTLTHLHTHTHSHTHTPRAPNPLPLHPRWCWRSLQMNSWIIGASRVWAMEPVLLQLNCPCGNWCNHTRVYTHQWARWQWNTHLHCLQVKQPTDSRFLKLLWVLGCKIHLWMYTTYEEVRQEV